MVPSAFKAWVRCVLESSAAFFREALVFFQSSFLKMLPISPNAPVGFCRVVALRHRLATLPGIR
jgi:hypothetical protein